MTPAPIDPSDPVSLSRAAWAEAALQLENAASSLAGLEEELAMLQQSDMPAEALISEALARRYAYEKELAARRLAEREARTKLRDLIEEALPRRSEQFARLSRRWPIVFLPVRIETRFNRPRSLLQVRIYPDELEVATHEPPLTAAERRAGREFWMTTNADPVEERQAWRKLLMTYPSTRAAWIVLSTSSSPAAADARLFPRGRSSSWASPAVTSVMPDCWVVRAYRGNAAVAEVVGRAIPDPLPVSLDPFADPSDPNQVSDLSGHGLEVDHDVAWTLDFDTAVQNGMAVNIPLQRVDIQLGFDELIVAGIKASLPPLASAHRLEALFHSHHYSRGFAFPRLGTPTKNTSETRSGHPVPDAGGEHSFPIERGAPLRTPEGNGVVFANALGIDPAVTDHIENADLHEQPNARAFNEALWPSTLGYFMRQMMGPVFTPTEIEKARAHFVTHVRGRGPLPPIRAGNRPYGTVPVTALSRWPHVGEVAALADRLPAELRHLLAVWSSQLASVPRVGRSSDADSDLAATLAMDGRTRRVHVRPSIGPVAQFNLLTFLGVPSQSWIVARNATAQNAFTQIGHPQWDAVIGWMSFDAAPDRFARELVAPALSESAPLSFNYIRWLRTATVDALRNETFPAGVTRPTALLYHVLRHAIVHEYLRLADLMVGTPPRPDEELIGFGPGAAPWQRLNTYIPLTGSQTLGEYLLDPAHDAGPLSAAPYRSALKAIEDLPTAELDRLFTETLDSCSHRLDAWITSIATRQLERMRLHAPFGAYIGGYGRVENLVPAPEPSRKTLSDGRTVEVQTGGGGHIHAPTMSHGSAAAVLRNAALTQAGTLDLSSGRVRKTLFVLDAVRNGEYLGSALGAQFERGLRGRGSHPQLQIAIDGLRNLFALVANKLKDSHQLPYQVAARNVVDGLRLYEFVRDGTFDLSGLPFDGTMRSWIEVGVKEIGDTIDAITELLTAESVFQSLRGNHVAAAASIETMSRGVRPPDLEIVRQPRGGTALTHRFAVILGETQAAPPEWTASASPRSAGAPHLDAWIGRLLGNPESIRCRTSYTDPQPGDRSFVAVREVTLADLQLRPIDFLAIARSGSNGGTSELDLRIAAAAQAPLGIDVTIDHSPWPNRAIRSFAEAIEVATAIGDVIYAARPLRPGDLLGTESAGAARPVSTSASMRGNDARTALTQTLSSLGAAMAVAETGGPAADLTQVRAQCAAASQFGVAGAIAASRAISREDLLERARAIRDELKRRVKDAATKTAPHEIAQSVFGREFVFLYEFAPWRPAELTQALSYAPTLVGDPLAARRWLQTAVPVRAALQRWQRMARYTAALGSAVTRLEVMQQPFVAGERWVALPFPTEDQRPPSGRVSIVLHRAASPPPTALWTGLLIDEWSEVIPAVVEQTSVALSYESPRAEAPQAVLVGVPPPGEAPWDFNLIFDTLRETFELARIRAVDLEALGAIGQIVPPVCLAANAENETVSTDLVPLLVEDP